MDWNYLWNRFMDLDPEPGQIALRLACAMLVGLIIGTEREYANRPAGMRTHILVALGACVVSITGEVLFHHYHALGANPDPARLAAQVITGVGFLGAGTIMREGVSVKGLTTAASLWAVACLGLACGFGYYAVAILGMIFIFVTLTVLETIQHKLLHATELIKDYELETEDLSKALELIDLQAQKNRANVEHMAVSNKDGRYRITFQAEVLGYHSKQRTRKFLEALASDPAVITCRQRVNT